MKPVNRGRKASRKSIDKAASDLERRVADRLMSDGMRIGKTGVSNVDAQGHTNFVIPIDLEFEHRDNVKVPALMRDALLQVRKAGGDTHAARFVLIHIYRRNFERALLCVPKDELLKLREKGIYTGVEVKMTSTPSKHLSEIEKPIYYVGEKVYVIPVSQLEYGLQTQR